MHEALTISALAKRTGVSSKTIRYWESLGLLPRAVRTHTGYRMFDPESVRYAGFIQKAKAIGLTLAEMGEVLRLARGGRCPCPEVVQYTERKVKVIEEQIRSLSVLLRRLKRVHREWKRTPCPEERCGDVCSLIEGLPEFQSSKGVKPHAKILVSHCGGGDDPCCDGRAGSCCN